MTAGQSRHRMRRHARRLRRYGLEPIAIINPGDPLPEIAAVVIGRWLWRYRSELAPLLAALATFAAGWLLHRTLRPAKAKAHLQPKRKIGYRPGRSEGDMYETVVSEGDLNSHSGVGLDVLNDDNDLPVRTLRDGVPDSQTIRWKMDPVRIWQRVPFGKRVGKCRDWFFKQVKDRPVGGVSKLVAAALRVRPRSCPGSGEPGHSLIPQVSASSSRVKIRPSPESDRMRLSASASPASRRRRRFSARSASSSARGIDTMSSVRAVMCTPHYHGGCPVRSLLARRCLTRQSAPPRMPVGLRPLRAGLARHQGRGLSGHSSDVQFLIKCLALSV